MATNSFNLIELYQKVFNIKGVRFAIPTGSTDAGNEGGVSNFTLDLPAIPQPKALSVLGTPIFEQITFKSSDREYTFPNWPLLDISASKNIVKTAIKGGKGTVKEYIGIDDYQITIRGILINNEGEEYPEDQVNEVHEFFIINKELKVTTPILNLLDIHNIVITDLRFPEVEGYNHIQPYVLQCLSDEPIEMIIRDAKNQRKIRPGL